MGLDWGERRELKSMGALLNNREMFNYFRDSVVVNSRKLLGVVERRRLTMEFIKQMDEFEDEQFRDNFDKFLRQIDEYLNTDSAGKQFGKADVYYNDKMILANISRVPWSRGKGKGNAR